MAKFDLKNISLVDVLPYKPNPIDNNTMINLHRDLEVELDKISFLTEVLRDKLYIVDDNLELIVDNVSGITEDLLKKLEKEIQDSITKLEALEKEVSSQVGSLTSEIDINRGGLSQEIQDRIDAIKKEAADRASAITASTKDQSDKLAAEALTLTNKIAKETQERTAAIAQEVSDRTSAVQIVATQLTSSIDKEVQDRTTAISQEAKTRADAIQKEQGDRGTAIATEKRERISEDKVLAQEITTLTSVVDGNTADIKSEARTRANEDSAIATRLDAIVASIGDVSGEIDNYSFDKGKTNWSTDSVGANHVPDNAPGVVKSIVGIGNVLELTGKNTIYYARALPVDTSRYYHVRFRVYQSKDNSNTTMQTVSAGIMTLDSSYNAITGGSGDASGNRFFAVDNKVILHSDGWQTFEGMINGVGDDADNFRTNTAYARPVFVVNGGGGSGVTEVDLLDFTDVTDRERLLATLRNEETARVSGDDALSKRVTTLTSSVNKNDLDISANASRITSAETTLAGKASVTEVESLKSVVQRNKSNAESALTRVSTVETDLLGKASVSSLNNLTSKVDQNASAITAEQLARSSADSSMASDIRKVGAKVTKAEGDIQANADSITKVDTTLTKSIADNVSSLTSKITNNSDSINADSKRITQVETDVAGKASSADVNSLSSKVNTNTSKIGSVVNRVTKTESDIKNLAVASDVLALTAKVNKNTTNILSETTARASADTALGQKLESLTTTVGNNSAAISSEAKTRSNADGSLSQRITTVSTSVGNNASAIKAEVVARTTADNTIGKRVDSLTSTVAGNSGAIQNEATTRANSDSALGKRIDTITASVGVNKASIQSEASTRANKDTALGKRIDTVTSATDNNTSAIRVEQSARATEDAALGQRITTLTSTVKGKAAVGLVSALSDRVTKTETDISGKANASDVNTLSSKVGKNSSDIITERNARASADNSINSAMQSLRSSVGNVESKADANANKILQTNAALGGKANALELDSLKVVVQNDKKLISANSNNIQQVFSSLNGKATASSVQTLTTRVNSNTASVETASKSINGLKAEYTIKTQAGSGVNRVITGIGVTADASKNRSEIAFLADKLFFIPSSIQKSFNPANAQQYSPFLVSGNRTYLKEAFIRDGTIDNAKIKNATISEAKILDGTIGNAKIKDLRADKITAGFLNVDRLQVNSINGEKITNGAITSAKIATSLQSDNYISGTRGWKIDRATGNVEFGEGHFRGTIEANKIIGDNVGGLDVAQAKHSKSFYGKGSLTTSVSEIIRCYDGSQLKDMVLNINEARDVDRYVRVDLGEWYIKSYFGGDNQGYGTSRLQFRIDLLDSKGVSLDHDIVEDPVAYRWSRTEVLDKTYVPTLRITIPAGVVGTLRVEYTWLYTRHSIGPYGNSNISLNSKEREGVAINITSQTKQLSFI